MDGSKAAFAIVLYPLYYSYQLHANCRALHKYTLAEKKEAAHGEGPGFDGELNNFQVPQLSSLSKLVSVWLLRSSDGCCGQILNDYFQV